MTPTDVLRDEHALIERGLDVLEALADRAHGGDAATLEPSRLVLEFLRVFADGVHHAKEEQMLFPALLDHGLPRHGGPVTVMLAEHDEGRSLIAQIGACLTEGLTSTESRERFSAAAHSYAELLRHHIMKENQVLWPMAENVLSAEAVADLTRRFERHGADNAAVRAHWERTVAELERQLGCGPAL